MSKPGKSLPVWVVIPAAGKGRRMNNAVPKQYLRFQGKTIIEHCLDRLLSHSLIDGAVLVLNPSDRHWESLNYVTEKPLFVTDGGDERQESVYKGLTSLQYRQGSEALVLVHDVVRPLIRHEDIDRLIETALASEAGALLAVPVTDTIKVENNIGTVSQTLPRENLWRAQTPQAFYLQPLLTALRQAREHDLVITDEAAAIEAAGFAPCLVEGSTDNLKITMASDFALAEQIWLYQRDQNNNK